MNHGLNFMLPVINVFTLFTCIRFNWIWLLTQCEISEGACVKSIKYQNMYFSKLFSPLLCMIFSLIKNDSWNIQGSLYISQHFSIIFTFSFYIDSWGKEATASGWIWAVEWEWWLGSPARGALLLHPQHVLFDCLFHWSEVSCTCVFLNFDIEYACHTILYG